MQEQIGQGAFATVYRAICAAAPENQQNVAMKVMDLEKITGDLAEILQCFHYAMLALLRF